MGETDGASARANASAIPELPPGLRFRRLEPADFSKGFIRVLGQLTTVGNVSEEQFQARFEELQRRNPDYHVFVIEDTEKQEVVAAGTLNVELKFIHSCGQIGRIEDIVVDENLRGKSLGKKIILELTQLAQSLGCYKVILNCKESNVPFYEKCAYERRSVLMAKYFDSE